MPAVLSTRYAPRGVLAVLRCRICVVRVVICRGSAMPAVFTTRCAPTFDVGNANVVVTSSLRRGECQGSGDGNGTSKSGSSINWPFGIGARRLTWGGSVARGLC